VNNTASSPSKGTLSERWQLIRKEFPGEAEQVARLAKKILAMDRITPDEVAAAAESEEIRELQALLAITPVLCERLGIPEATIENVLSAIDLYAASILTELERK
tara:strand:- start:457161 stop:457472 length:312 start_codon:yes stop_codon:yes gene_type:complete